MTCTPLATEGDSTDRLMNMRMSELIYIVLGDLTILTPLWLTLGGPKDHLNIRGPDIRGIPEIMFCKILMCTWSFGALVLPCLGGRFTAGFSIVSFKFIQTPV